MGIIYGIRMQMQFGNRATYEKEYEVKLLDSA